MKQTFIWRCLIAMVLLIGVVSPAGLVKAGALQQDGMTPEQKAQVLLAHMTPEEKVSQLFLVTFDGNLVDRSSRIYSLIYDYHIGGIMLRAENDNFLGPENTVETAAEMIRTLQLYSYEGSTSVTTDSSGNPQQSQYIPLFVGISQEGDGYPYDQILNGMTVLPNEMAIGATWKTELAEQVGQVLGSELKSMGFNLFFGPSLDVLDVIHTEGSEDLGTRTFGGDPYWVGEMGKAYISGLHQGSEGGLAVIAKHFPGRGGSDRQPEEEVATVRKSLEQLKQIELAPFFAVTGNAPDLESAADGLLVSHIRYQGFQGNIRATTRPVSLDQAALSQVLSLEPLKNWLDTGGLVVSDDLGSMAVRRSFDPTGQSFDARQVARSAFLSGNDLLYVDDFVATNDQDSYTTILRTLEMFAQKYREDPAFAERVDQSVKRVLTLKYRLYPEFNLDQVQASEDGLQNIGAETGLSFEVARQAVSLISPDPEEINVVLPRAPELRDRIVFLTDTQSARQCTVCAERPVVSVDALQNAVLRLYGPEAGGQVLDITLASYSFNDLDNFLDDPTKMEGLENDLVQADWVVVGFLNTQSYRETSLAFKRLLSERSDLIRNKRVIAFAFNAPYYLDATDISKLTAYYALYSKQPAFIDVAARILFQELPPTGALPVSVPGVGYDLIIATTPDPNQVIPIHIDSSPSAEITPQAETVTPEPVAAPSFQVGDTIPLRTGVIYDHNRNPVPDNTPVRFLFTTGADPTAVQQIETVTDDGVARASFRIATPGLLEIRVVSDPASISSILQLNVVEGQPAALTTLLPSPMPTETLEPTPTLTPTLAPLPTELPPPPPPAPGVVDWFLVMLVVWAATAGVYFVGFQTSSSRWAVRWALISAAGGLIAYTIAIVSWSAENWLGKAGIPGLIAIALGGVLVGWGVGLVWKQWLANVFSVPPRRSSTESR